MDNRYLAFIVIFGIVAAFLVCLKMALEHKETAFVLTQKTFWILVMIHSLIAGLVCYLIFVKGKAGNDGIDFVSTTTIAALFGYPLLLRSKLFTFNTGKEQVSAGPEELLTRVEKRVIEVIDRSLVFKRAAMLDDWLKQDPEIIRTKTKNILQGLDASTLVRGKTITELSNWVDTAVNDYLANKNNSAALDNLRAIFSLLLEVGGLRAVYQII